MITTREEKPKGMNYFSVFTYILRPVYEHSMKANGGYHLRMFSHQSFNQKLSEVVLFISGNFVTTFETDDLNQGLSQRCP